VPVWIEAATRKISGQWARMSAVLMRPAMSGSSDGDRAQPLEMGATGADRIEFAADSPVEEAGFETSIPLTKYVALFAERCGQKRSIGVASNRLTISAGPEVRISLPPAASHERTGERCALQLPRDRAASHIRRSPIETDHLSIRIGHHTQREQIRPQPCPLWIEAPRVAGGSPGLPAC
jgi:hypothetical protein